MMMKELSSNNITLPSCVRGMNILVVDYDTTSLMYLASLLEQYSYKVTTTEVALVALSMIRENKSRFKLVMANVNMTDMDCLTFLRVLLKKNIPVILLASKRDTNFAERALAEGASFYLEKPISSEDLQYLWQHVFKTYILNEIGQKEDRGILNSGKATEQAVKNNSEAGSSVLSRSAQANNELHCKNFNDDNKQKELVEAAPVNEDRVRGSSISSFAEQHSKENLKQGELLKTKRLLMNDHDEGGKQKEKKIRLSDDSQDTSQMEMGGNEMNETTKTSIKKENRRLLWNAELHRKFTAAVSVLGDKKARPKLILQKMNVPNLTQRQVASHLQKYKAQVQKISEARTPTVPSVPSTLPLPYSTLFGRSIHRSSSNAYDKMKLLSSQPGNRHFANSGICNLGSSGNVFNAGKSVPSFTERRSFEVESMAPPADPAPPSCPLNENLQPSSEFVDLMNLLDEEEEGLKGFDSDPNPGDVERYCEWLNDVLLGECEQPLMEPQQTMEPLNTPEVEGGLFCLNYSSHT